MSQQQLPSETPAPGTVRGIDDFLHGKSVAARTKMSSIFQAMNLSSQQSQNSLEVPQNSQATSPKTSPRVPVKVQTQQGTHQPMKLLGEMFRSIFELHQAADSDNKSDGSPALSSQGTPDLSISSPGDNEMRIDELDVSPSPVSPMVVNQSIFDAQTDEKSPKTAAEASAASPSAATTAHSPINMENNTDTSLADGGYVHGWTDSLENELVEFGAHFSLQGVEKLHRSCFARLLSAQEEVSSPADAINVFLSMKRCEQQEFIENLLAVFELQNREAHTQSLRALIYLLRIAPEQSARLILNLDGLPCLISNFKLYIRELMEFIGSIAAQRQRLIEQVDLAADALYLFLLVISENCTLNHNLIPNEVIACLIDADMYRNSSSQAEFLASVLLRKQQIAEQGDVGLSTVPDNFLQYLIDLLHEMYLHDDGKSPNGRLLPLKKLACLLNKSLLIVLGKPHSKSEHFVQGPGMTLKVNAEDVHADVHLHRKAATPPVAASAEAAADDMFDASGYPKSLKEALNIFQSVQFSSSSPSAEAVAVEAGAAYDDEAQRRLRLRELTREPPRIMKRESDLPMAERIYRQLLPQMADFVLVVLKLVLGVTEHCMATQQTGEAASAASWTTQSSATASSKPFSEAPCLEFQLMYHSRNPLVFARDCQVVLKNLTQTLLLLLKHFKHNDAVQFLHLRTLLCDANTVILLLNILNRDLEKFVNKKYAPEEQQGWAAMLAGLDHLTSPPPSPSAEGSKHKKKSSSQIKITKFDLDPSSSSGDIPVPIQYSWRTLNSCITVARLLQKLTKNNLAAVRSLIDLKVLNIIKKAVKVEHNMLRLYVLKSVKSCVRYMDQKWRKSNMRLINMVYFYCKPTLIDNWLAPPQPLEQDTVEAKDQEIRQRVFEFNAYHYDSWWQFLNDQDFIVTFQKDKMLYLPENGFLPVSRMQYLYSQIPEPQSQQELAEYLRAAYPQTRYPLLLGSNM